MDMDRIWEYYGKVAKEFGESPVKVKDEEGNATNQIDEDGNVVYKRENYSLQFFYEDGDLERLTSQSTLFKAFMGDEEAMAALPWDAPLPSEDEISQWLNDSRNGNKDNWPNASQCAAIRYAISQPLTLIQGPPGTGKTEMILNLLSVIHERYPSKTVAVVSANNEAINNVTDKIETDEAFSGLREAYAALGNQGIRERWQKKEEHKRIYEGRFTNDKEFRFKSEFLFLEEEHCKPKPQFSSTIHSMRKIFVEDTAAGRPFANFDYVIVDECSLVSTLLGLLAMASAKEHLVLIGDNNQLTPIMDENQLKKIDDYYSKEDVPENYRVTAENTFLKVCEKVFDKAESVTLIEHYRCHRAIIGFCNQYVYIPDGHELILSKKVDENDREVPIRVLWYEGEYSEYIPLRTGRDDETRRSLSNMRQIEVFMKDEWPVLCRCLAEKPDTSICVISPYRGQIESLKKRLIEEIREDENADEELRRSCDEWIDEEEASNKEQEWIRNLKSEHILTIHKSQGKGFDIVCFLSVCDYDSPTHDPWPQERRMINVAVSRAKEEFHLITCNQWLPEEFQEKECGYILPHPDPKDSYYLLKFVDYTYEKFVQMKGSGAADLTDGDFGFHRSKVTSLFDRVPAHRRDGLGGASAPEECMRDFLLDELPEGYRIYREVPLGELYPSKNCESELREYIENGARVDFLICSKDHKALLAIEVDGELHRFGEEVEKQKEWDKHKNECFDAMGNEVAFLRIRTDGSGHWECRYKKDNREITSEEKHLLSIEDEKDAIKDYLYKAAGLTNQKRFDNGNKTAIAANEEACKNKLLGYYMDFLRNRCLNGKGLKAYWDKNRQLPRLDYREQEFIKHIDYSDRATDCYYFCEYGTAYAFEYAMLYEIMLRSYEGERFQVYSFGCGGYIDAWSLAYAKARLKAYGFGDGPKLDYQGIDLVEWPVNVFYATSVAKNNARITISIPVYNNVLSALGYKMNMVKSTSIQEFEPKDNQGRKSDKMDRNVLVFPKILNELDDAAVDAFVNQLGKLRYEEQAYYICASHSPSDLRKGKKKGAEAVSRIVNEICIKGGYKATSDLHDILGDEQYENCIGRLLTRFRTSDFSWEEEYGNTCYFIGGEFENCDEGMKEDKKGLPIERLNSDFACEEVKDYLEWINRKNPEVNKCSQMINANIAFQIIKLEKEDSTGIKRDDIKKTQHDTRGKRDDAGKMQNDADKQQNQDADMEWDIEKRAFMEKLRKHKSICWCPSAGCDFRALLYLSKPFYAKHEELSAENAVLPDLFILTDYIGIDYNVESVERWPRNFAKMREGTLKRGDVLFEDFYTTLTVKNIEKFYIGDFIKEIDAYIDLIDVNKIPAYYGQGYYMTIKIDSHNNSGKRLGVWETNVIYLYAENTAFAKNILLRNKIDIDYIVRVNYDNYCKWLFYLAGQLNVKYYVSDIFGDELPGPGDMKALEYLKGDSGIDFDEPKLTALYRRNWYYREHVTWYRVER